LSIFVFLCQALLLGANTQADAAKLSQMQKKKESQEGGILRSADQPWHRGANAGMSSSSDCTAHYGKALLQ
jgi:hypothetical protein